MLNHDDVLELRSFVTKLGIADVDTDKIVGFVQNEFKKA
jgi:hypothetical protein